MAKSGAERQEQKNAHNRKLSLEGRNIQQLPDVADPARREACQYDFQLFCETYFKAVFALDWSPDHLIVITKIQTAVIEGGLFAMALPRGMGKTSLCLAAAVWALLYGHRQFVVLIGSSEDAATDLLDNIKGDLETNELLAADFPEVCVPIQTLDGIVNRAAGQLYKGERTNVGWTAKELVLPTIKGSIASGSCIKVAGITGRIRGMMIKKPDGSTARPDFVLIDDPQTDESANSPKQVRDRLNVVAKAILGLAGPGKKISGFMPVTVIAKGDMADQVLDKKKFPQWQGERIKMLTSLPKNMKLWEEYDTIRRDGLADGRGISEATAFYREHQSAMDEGAQASWDARFNPDEDSAIQHAMNLKLTNDEAFASEYQNEPLSLESEATLKLVADQVVSKAVEDTDLIRGVVPAWCTKLTAFIDVQKDVLFYTVCAWDDEFSGHVVDYGTWPEQGRHHFNLRELTRTIRASNKGMAYEGQLYEALKTLTDKLLGKAWKRLGGGESSVDRLMVDANWGETSSLVKKFCRESAHKAKIIPTHGRGITADKIPLNRYKPKPGERTGWNWRIYPSPDHHAIYDVNSWKTFVSQRILQASGEKGNLTLFHVNSATHHRMFSEHTTAEYPTLTSGPYGEVNVWKLRPNQENHWLDCLVGCAVAASEQGVLFEGHAKGDAAKKRKKFAVKF